MIERPLFPLFGLLLVVSNYATLGQESGCQRTLGMQDGSIPDSHITASSSHNEALRPATARVREEIDGGAWCPASAISKGSYEYLQIDLDKLMKITLVETQGRFFKGKGSEFAESYRLEYQRVDGSHWIKYRNYERKEVIDGNVNTHGSELRQLNPAIIAKKIRFIPHSERQRKVCMRVELYGCEWTDGVVSYTAPQGDSFSPALNFRDYTYDGIQRNGMLIGGIGQLLDKEKGSDNFRQMFYGHAGFVYVGWKNQTDRQQVELTFEFDTVRTFQTVHLHVSNSAKDGMTAFKRADIWFSLNGRQFLSPPVIYRHIRSLRDKVLRSLLVQIKLENRIGRFVRLQLHFGSEWLLLSEVIFTSEVYRSNLSTPTLDKTKLDTITISNTAVNNSTLTPLVYPKSGDPLNDGFIVAIIGCLSVVILIVCILLVIFVVRYRRHKSLHHEYGDSKDSSFGTPVNLLNYSPPPPTEGKYCNGNLYTPVVTTEQHHIQSHRQQPRPDIQQCSYFTRGHNEYFPDLTQQTNNPNSLVVSLNDAGQQHTTTTTTTTVHNGTLPPTLPRPRNSPKHYYSQPPAQNQQQQQQTFTPSNRIHPPPPPMTSQSAVPVTSSSAAVSPPVPPFSPYLRSVEIPAPSSELLRHRANLNNLSSLLAPPPSASTGLPCICGVTGSSNVQLYEKSSWLIQTPQQPLHEIHRSEVRTIETIGRGLHGQIILCELDSGNSAKQPKTVAMKVLNDDASSQIKSAFLQETKIQCQLKDANLAQIVGVCMRDDPFAVLVQYTDCDLHQYLSSGGAALLSVECLIHLASQVASGMKYLESLFLAHRDLACRNCLIDTARQRIKISDLAASIPEYRHHYADLCGNGNMLPVRWMAWESIALHQFSSCSDTWAFGTTLWEMFMSCSELPYSDLSDGELSDLLRNCLESNDTCTVQLAQPRACPREVYDLMCECWNFSQAERPAFKEIHLFLQRKTVGYSPQH